MATNTGWFGETPLKNGNLKAPADWSGSDGNGTFQFRGVDTNPATVDTAQLGATKVGPGRPGIGILANGPKLGESCLLIVQGEYKVLAGAAFANGDSLMLDANGRFITATAGKVVVGVALAPSNQAGDLVTALVNFLNFSAGA